MAIASQLPTEHEITIVGKNLPGDDMDPEYTSQWAGAIWLGDHDSGLRERQMQLDGLSALWSIAGSHPESSARRITMREVMDYGSVEDVWYRDYVPGFRLMSRSELPKGAKFGMEWQTVVITPTTFLPFLRERLEARGVVFKRMIVRSLADLKGLAHHILVNASGGGSTELQDVLDSKIVPMKQQNIRIRQSGYDRLADGTIYIGGIKTPGFGDFAVNEDHRKIIIQRAHTNQPDVFPSPNIEDYDFICDHVGVFYNIAKKDGGVRVEKQIVGGQKVVHAYGMEAGGYVFSFGLAREAAKLVSEFNFEPIKLKL
ncbi:hypothetical protein LTR96_011231 [Exophiala xenobiotica]|nr:hypothetical protein LTR41_011414 [Exophiala xenobiotica]KAK5215168.1 hypothetical protein LTR72_011759 [Exophiala xenobiotica]KAK5220324.1 hypothetical protein LTR47_011242 [Exophiala xenobiotica]KAK5243201.1 hypothetical protein LTS06_010983 [Exophiala xenobiotica]KAK5263356.1 hypothetical protein LTR96_011231 [Exophiala xenobiotica]